MNGLNIAAFNSYVSDISLQYNNHITATNVNTMQTMIIAGTTSGDGLAKEVITAATSPPKITAAKSATQILIETSTKFISTILSAAFATANSN